MFRRSVGIVAALVGGAALFAVANVGGGGSPDSLPVLWPMPTIGVLAVVVGMSAFVGATGYLRPASVAGTAGVAALVCVVATLGYAVHGPSALDQSTVYAIVAFGILPATTGAAVKLEDKQIKNWLSVAVIATVVWSAIYFGNDLVVRIPLHLAGMLPGFVVGLRYTANIPSNQRR